VQKPQSERISCKGQLVVSMLEKGVVASETGVVGLMKGVFIYMYIYINTHTHTHTHIYIYI